MKVPGAKAAGFCARPDPGLRGALLFGPDPALTAARRRDLVAAITGGDDLRLTRMDPETARGDPAALADALRARGFFPGRRAVLMEGAKDGVAEAVAGALDGTTAEDAVLVVTAGILPARSALRKIFEGAGDLAALQLYPDRADASDFLEMLRRRGCTAGLTAGAAERARSLAAELDPVTLEGLADTVALYAMGREAPVEAWALAALAPGAPETEIDALVGAVAEGRRDRVGPLLARLAASGVQPPGALAALRLHFRQGLAARVDERGPRAYAERAFRGRNNPRRDAFLARLGGWDRRRLEAANRLLFETERTLRSAGDRPVSAIAERCCLRLAWLAGRG